MVVVGEMGVTWRGNGTSHFSSWPVPVAVNIGGCAASQTGRVMGLRFDVNHFVHALRGIKSVPLFSPDFEGLFFLAHFELPAFSAQPESNAPF
jgi:hypothetical protein